MGESVFLERMRKWILDGLRAMTTYTGRANCYLLYPRKSLWPRFGSCPDSKWDQYEVRPIFWRHDADGSQGAFATYTMVERHHIRMSRFHGSDSRPSWRKNVRTDERALVVYPNIAPDDRRWLMENPKYWRRKDVVPSLHIGWSGRTGLGKDPTRWYRKIWCYDDETLARVRQGVDPAYGGRIPWEGWWKHSKPLWDFGLAGNWRAWGNRRHPEIAYRWVQHLGGTVYRAKDNGTWEDLLETTRCRVYLVASTQDVDVPYDAFIAHSQGAILVAPDVPAYRACPEPRLLYPTSFHQARGSLSESAWSPAEVGSWLQARLRASLERQGGGPGEAGRRGIGQGMGASQPVP